MWKCYSLFTAQNDFIDGSLKVDGAVDIVNPIGQIIENEELWGQVKKKRLGLFAIPFFVWKQLDLTKVVYSADWHPQNHISFFSNLQSRWSKWFQNKQLRTDWHISPEPSILSGVRAILAKSRCSTRFRKFHNPSRDDSRLCLRLLPQTDPSLTSKHSGLTIASKSLKVIDEECDLRLFPHPQEQSSTPTCLHLPVCWEREPTLRFVSKFTKFSKTPIFPSGRLLLCVLRQHWQRRRGQHRIGWPDCWNHWGPPMNVLLANLLKKKTDSFHFSFKYIYFAHTVLYKFYFLQVVLVGLATDYCVGSSALHAIKEVGWRSIWTKLQDLLLASLGTIYNSLGHWIESRNTGSWNWNSFHSFNTAELNSQYT